MKVGGLKQLPVILVVSLNVAFSNDVAGVLRSGVAGRVGTMVGGEVYMYRVQSIGGQCE